MNAQQYDIGVVGLGTMGRNLALNIAEHGYTVVGLDRDPARTHILRTDAGELRIDGTDRPGAFAEVLKQPRAVLMLVPAGAPVEAVIHELTPLLAPGDLLIDGGNSHFTNTDTHAKALGMKGLMFMGLGVSGGEAGARHGPSLMPGGPREAYDRVRPILEAVAAQVDGEPCVAYLGPGSAGHYVKMVHNGIEYGLMELIAEAYDLMTRGLGMTAVQMHDVFHGWNESELNSFLIEITVLVLGRKDTKTGRPLVDLILDVARQKGTGKWTSQDAMELQVPIPTIDAAVAMRDLSAYDQERAAASQTLTGPRNAFDGDRTVFLTHLHQALYAAMIITYSQGMALLHRASNAYGYHISLEAVARIWRGGCIIRAAVLEDIRAAYKKRPDLENLLLNPRLSDAVMSRQDDLRAVVRTAVGLGLPAAGFMAAMSYYDGYRSARLPANLVQAQRDCFGAHTYERVDADGVFHTQWDKGQ
jgi:6-phosphogluconate dehydrogenase